MDVSAALRPPGCCAASGGVPSHSSLPLGSLLPSPLASPKFLPPHTGTRQRTPTGKGIRLFSGLSPLPLHGRSRGAFTDEVRVAAAARTHFSPSPLCVCARVYIYIERAARLLFVLACGATATPTLSSCPPACHWCLGACLCSALFLFDLLPFMPSSSSIVVPLLLLLHKGKERKSGEGEGGGERRSEADTHAHTRLAPTFTGGNVMVDVTRQNPRCGLLLASNRAACLLLPHSPFLCCWFSVPGAQVTLPDCAIRVPLRVQQGRLRAAPLVLLLLTVVISQRLSATVCCPSSLSPPSPSLVPCTVCASCRAAVGCRGGVRRPRAALVMLEKHRSWRGGGGGGLCHHFAHLWLPSR